VFYATASEDRFQLAIGGVGRELPRKLRANLAKTIVDVAKVCRASVSDGPTNVVRGAVLAEDNAKDTKSRP
jgi:hypothetical protein